MSGTDRPDSTESWSPGDKVRLETPNFVLRSLGRKDIGDRFMSWFGNAALMERLGSKARPSRDRALKFLNRIDNASDFILGIFPRDTDALAGWIRIYHTPEHRRAGLAILIGEKLYRGRENTGELQRAVHDFLFQTLRVHKAVAVVHGDDIHGRRLAERCGYRLEVLLHDHERTRDGSRRDIANYGLLEPEWRAARDRTNTP